MKKYIFVLTIQLFLFVQVFQCYAQQASATWALTNPTTGGTGLSSLTSGTILAVDEKFKGTEVNGYTGTNNSQRIRMAGTNNSWAANLTSKIDTVYVQFAVSPKVGSTLTITNISLSICASSTSTMKAAIYYSADPDFKNPIEISYSSGNTNNYLYSNAFTSVTAATNVTLQNSGTFYLRVYPWHESASISTGKYMCLQNVVISGIGTGVNAELPTLKTTEANYISTTFVTSGGTVTNDGGAIVTSRGLCWNTTGSPTISDYKLENGTGVGQFVSNPTTLTANTKYYLRAYAVNSTGIAYGNEITFTTLETKVVPKVISASVSSVLAKTATCGGNVTEWGGDAVAARGVCWSTQASPTINDNKTVNGKDLGLFTSNMSELKPNTVYYVRAYATNGVGTGYGSELIFTTQAQAANVKKVVATDGSGDYKTVQAAFDAIPDNYTGVWTVYVKNGTYKEKIILTALKSNVILEGESKDKTILVYDDYSGRVVNGITLGTSTSQTVAIDANDFTAKNITFQNTSTVAQAVALRIQGDRHAYYNCKLLGYQDTYYTWGGSGVGRAYMKNCFIEGSVDFIFGRNVVVFDKCTINVNRNGGTLTAASTDAATQFGYVFINCKITANEIGFDGGQITNFVLGRPWQNAPKTVFIKCEEPTTLAPAGWSSWNVSPGLYAEYKCYGPGSDTKQRNTSISKQLSDQEASAYSITNILSKNTSPTFSYDWMPDTTAVTSIEDEASLNSIPTKLELYQNYPNPFNPSTSIQYQLPKNGHVKIVVYDIVGTEVSKLVNEEKQAGFYVVKFDGGSISSGVYIYQIQTSNYIQSRKMILIK